ncbi:MAG: hypothetical protein EOM79_04165, partial [Epsilonproteobacteria bacterium]|nr:hypothetical protein [Campylobacterota bacterium]
NKITGNRIGCINFGYEHAVKRMLKARYEKNDMKPAVFLHVHNAGRLLARIEKAFIDFHNEIGVPYRIFNVDDSSERTYLDFMEYFKKHRKGFFIAYRDSIGAAIVNAATDSGLKVPDDVEVISIIGTKYAEIIRPTLSSFYINMQEVGKRAMYMLIDLSNGELNEKAYKFESTYTARNSTKE